MNLGFERDEGKVSIHWGIEGQRINTPFPFTLYYQGGGVLSCPYPGHWIIKGFLIFHFNP